MSRNILIATLGESPIVVTTMVNALKKEIGRIDELHVIYPQNGDQLIDFGYSLVEEHLRGTCTVTPHQLPFHDTNTRETSIKFLQTLSGLIRGHEHKGNDVYLSLAGGRKNMSALMAVTCQFFECICGLYHILDKHEDSDKMRNFYSIEELCDLEHEGKHKEKLSPTLDELILVGIPYTRLSNGVALQRYFAGEQSSIEVEAELDAFYSKILQVGETNRKEENNLFDVYLSKKAYEFYQNGDKEKLKTCFKAMKTPKRLNKHLHSWAAENREQTDCYCFAMKGKKERLFYYKEDTSITIATIVEHDAAYNEILNGSKSLWSCNHPREINSNHLDGGILIAPLGKSPMVVTQTFQLLKNEGADIKKVIVVHPNNDEIRNGVELLETAFERRSENFFESCPINDIEDLKSHEDCKTYLETLVSLIENTEKNTPDKRIYLSLSGGRKGMAALTLFAAQLANIDAVYHTLIADADLEKRIEEETNTDALCDLSKKDIKLRLFLDNYDRSKFELFRVPVIPISIESVET